jgi:RimJ/RimL family protein N-acetyltransferase
MLEAGEAEFVESLYAKTQVTRTLLRIQRPLSIEGARDFCRTSMVACDDHRLGAVLQTDGKPIALGSVRAHPEVPSVVSIGYSVLPAYWGQGLGTELAALLVRVAIHLRTATALNQPTA